MHDDFYKKVGISTGVALVAGLFFYFIGGRLLSSVAVLAWLMYLYFAYRDAAMNTTAKPVLERAAVEGKEAMGRPVRWTYKSPALTIEADFEARVVRIDGDIVSYDVHVGNMRSEHDSYRKCTLPFDTLTFKVEPVVVNRSSPTVVDETRFENGPRGLTSYIQPVITGYLHTSGYGAYDLILSSNTAPLNVRFRYDGQPVFELARGEYPVHKATCRCSFDQMNNYKPIFDELQQVIAEGDKPRKDALIAAFLADSERARAERRQG
jgi:hypothetical protein